jgi:uncharacterized protein (TIRG00374 family)
LAFLTFALWNVDFAQLGRALASANKSAIVPFLLALFAFYWVKAVRWRWLLAPIKDVPTHRLFPPLMVGYAVSMVVPMHLGEVARVLVARSEQGIRASALLMSIALERLLDLVTIPFLFALAMSVRDDLPSELVNAGYAMGFIGLAGIVFIAVFVAWPERVLAATSSLTRVLPAALGRAVVAQLRASADGAAVLREPKRMLVIVALTLLQWALMWGCVFVSVAAVGIATSWSASLLTVALINVAVALPTSPGFVGSVQAAFVVALLPFAVEREAAVAASIYFHVLIYVAVVATGLTFLRRAGRSVKSVIAASRS